jgi:hypothetical protein
MRTLHYGLKQTAAPASEPVTRAEAKLWTRLSITDDDAIIDSLITAARQWCEDYTGRAFVTQSWRLTLDQFPGVGLVARPMATAAVWPGWWDWPAFWDLVRLPKAPLVSIDSVQYVDSLGATQTIDPSLYQADTESEPGRLRPSYSQTWPAPRLQLASVRVTYTCGYGAAAAVPEGVKTAIKMLLGAWYENREAIGDKPMTESPMAVRALLDQHCVGSYVLMPAWPGSW